jgi:hypothetical protein
MMSRMTWFEDPNVGTDEDSGDIQIGGGGSSGTQDLSSSDPLTGDDPD